MCQLSLLHTKDGDLNRRLLLLLTSIGSAIHDDGFGVANNSGKIWKTESTACWVINSGKIIRKDFPGDGPLMGHIRLASPRIPVTLANSHPFASNDTVIMHNGGLTPKDEKEFIMEEDVEETDAKTSITRKVKVRVSDTRIFFDEFIKTWTPDKTWDNAFRETMDKFYGKFAFMMYVNGQIAVIRGKTADLHISYLLNKRGGKPVGYAINTDKLLLDKCTTLVSNLQQLDGKPELIWTLPELIQEESIFIAGDIGLDRIGDIKEGISPPKYAPAVSRLDKGQDGKGNFTRATPGGGGGNSSTSVASDTVVKSAETIFDFMNAHSLSLRDIQFMLMIMYNISSTEITPLILRNFVEVAIPMLRSGVEKGTRRSIRKALKGFPLSSNFYYKGENDLEFPWILSKKTSQNELLKSLEESKTK